MLKHCRLCDNFKVKQRSFGYSDEGGCYSFPYNCAECTDKRAERIFKQIIEDRDDEYYGGSYFNYMDNFDCPYYERHDSDYFIKELSSKDYSSNFYDLAYVISGYDDNHNQYTVSITRSLNNPKDFVLFIGELSECQRFFYNLTGKEHPDIPKLEEVIKEKTELQEKTEKMERMVKKLIPEQGSFEDLDFDFKF